MREADERQRVKARRRPCERGEAEARRARPRARVAADKKGDWIPDNGESAARRRAIRGGGLRRGPVPCCSEEAAMSEKVLGEIK